MVFGLPTIGSYLFYLFYTCNDYRFTPEVVVVNVKNRLKTYFSNHVCVDL